MPIDPFSRFPSAGKTDLEARLGISRRQDPEPDDLAIARARDAARHAKFAARRSPDLASADFREEIRRSARQRSERTFKADSANIAKLLSMLWEAPRDLLGFQNQGGLAYGRLVGLDLGSDNQFWDGFRNAVTLLTSQGFTTQATRNKIALDAMAMGVTRENAIRIEPSKPSARIKFDEFAASMPADPSFASAVQAGMADGLPPGLLETLSAMLGAMRAAVLADDRSALEKAGSDFGSLAVALFDAVNGSGETSQRSYQFRQSGADSTRVKKGAVEISKDFWVDESDVVWSEDGQPRLRKGAAARPRYAAAREGK